MLLHIRQARLEDAREIAAVRIITWRVTYRNLLPEDVLANLSYEKSEETWREILSSNQRQGYAFAAEDLDLGKVVGFAIGGPERNADLIYLGELYAIYILPEYQGKGLGRRLCTVVARRLLKAGMNSMLIWMLNGNPADGFYRAMGGVPRREMNVTIGDGIYRQTGYAWLNIKPLAESTPPEEDES
jgi:GNAT superfamily N-acetyltransferase